MDIRQAQPIRGRWVVRLFPAAWRRRYADELVAILELQPPSLRQLIGLLYCALDAHLDPQVSDGGEFSFMEGRPTMRTRILAGAAVGGGLLLLFGLVITVSDGALILRLTIFYALVTVGLIGIHRRQAGHMPVVAWLGFVPALVAYSLSLAGMLAGLADLSLPGIAGMRFGVFAQQAFWVTSVLFGVVTLAIGVLPRTAALALALGAAMVMIGVFIGPPSELAMELVARVGVIAYGGGFVWLGLSGWAPRPSPMTSTA